MEAYISTIVSGLSSVLLQLQVLPLVVSVQGGAAQVPCVRSLRHAPLPKCSREEIAAGNSGDAEPDPRKAAQSRGGGGGQGVWGPGPPVRSCNGTPFALLHKLTRDVCVPGGTMGELWSTVGGIRAGGLRKGRVAGEGGACGVPRPHGRRTGERGPVKGERAVRQVSPALCRLVSDLTAVGAHTLMVTSPQLRLGTSVGAAKGAHGNATEELFVLTLLLCSLVRCGVQVSVQHLHPTAGGHAHPIIRPGAKHRRVASIVQGPWGPAACVVASAEAPPGQHRHGQGACDGGGGGHGRQDPETLSEADEVVVQDRGGQWRVGRRGPTGGRPSVRDTVHRGGGKQGCQGAGGGGGGGVV